MYSTCAAVPLYTRTWNEREDSDQQPELLDEVTDTYGQKNHKKRVLNIPAVLTALSDIQKKH